MMPLTLAELGEENMIRHIGGKPDVRQHLETLGFVVGGTCYADLQRSAAT